MKKIFLLMSLLFIFVGTKSISLNAIAESSVTKDKSESSILSDSNFDDVFKDIRGCAVIFDKQENKYYFYNNDMAQKRVSPYSTFKIVATLLGLQNGIIKDEQSKMNYSGTEYPLDVWNENLSLSSAFKFSCIWYFRQIIDAIGKNTVEKELNELSYGNCNVSEWNGSNINPMLDLNGFWLNSSLQISPFEQVNILAKLFEGQSIYSTDNIKILKNIMFIADDGTNQIYGKTGTGLDGKAWFIGFKEHGDKRKYIAVYLDAPDKKENINGQLAKEIALMMFPKTNTVDINLENIIK